MTPGGSSMYTISYKASYQTDTIRPVAWSCAFALIGSRGPQRLNLALIWYSNENRPSFKTVLNIKFNFRIQDVHFVTKYRENLLKCFISYNVLARWSKQTLKAPVNKKKVMSPTFFTVHCALHTTTNLYLDTFCTRKASLSTSKLDAGVGNPVPPDRRKDMRCLRQFLEIFALQDMVKNQR